MPRQMKGSSFTVRPGRQASLSRQVRVNTKATRFQPANALPLVQMMRGIKQIDEGMAESQEERIQQAS